MICVRCACGNCNRYERSSYSSAAASSLTDIYLHNSLCTHTKMKRKKGKIAYLILDPLLPFRHFATDDKTKPQRVRKRKKKRKASILFFFFLFFFFRQRVFQCDRNLLSALFFLYCVSALSEANRAIDPPFSHCQVFRLLPYPIATRSSLPFSLSLSFSLAHFGHDSGPREERKFDSLGNVQEKGQEVDEGK